MERLRDGQRLRQIDGRKLSRDAIAGTSLCIRRRTGVAGIAVFTRF
jgi:hypothetical protein